MRFKYSTLQKATDDFSVSRKIGRGGYGEVFKVQLISSFRFCLSNCFLCLILITVLD